MLIYHPDLSVPRFELSAEEAQHVVKVKRMQLGDSLEITDGRGRKVKARIQVIAKKSCEVEILEEMQVVERSYGIHLGIAPTKNLNRMEWMLEKCVELGLDRLSFIQSKHSERKHMKLDRLEKIAISALKQSKQVYKPQIEGLESFDDFIKKDWGSKQKFLAYVPEESGSSLFQTLPTGGDILILIGPEGGFSPQEYTRAKDANFAAVRLASHTLRTETAGLVACHTVHLRNLADSF